MKSDFTLRIFKRIAINEQSSKITHFNPSISFFDDLPLT